WDVSSATNMLGMFASAASFNKAIDDWDVSRVKNMSLMFWNAIAFNQAIDHWDVGNVRDMEGMFKETSAFNHSLGNWNVVKVTDMNEMFLDAKAFNQDISGWCVPVIKTEPDNFASNSPLTQAHKPNWGTCDVQANGIADTRLTQSTQNKDRTVPMVTGRDAALQVFFDASQESANYLYDKQDEGKFNQDVTATLYNNGLKVKEISVPAGTKALYPISSTRAIMSIFVSGDYIQPGLSVKITTSNGWSYPENGKRLSVTVKDVPEFRIRLIPIYVTTRDKTGDVDENNAEEYMQALLDMYPVKDYEIDIHESITVDPSSEDNLYSEALSEIQSIWVDEGKPDYYYYGVIPQSKGGVVGLGYVRGRQAVGW